MAVPRTTELSEFDPVFGQAIERGLNCEPLTQAQVEALLLSKGQELFVLMMAADSLRKRLVGDVVTYVVNRNLNFTNICDCRCAFCGFARKPQDPDAYLLPMVDIRRKVREAKLFGATEICAQGGINPKISLGYLLDLLGAIREEMPDVHIHAFSPMEIDHVAKDAHLSIGETLEILRESGLGSMPGTAAEILVERVRKAICPSKISSDRWEEIVVTAHDLGLPTTSTLMYGTVESISDRASSLLRIRSIQERTSGFTEFVPLPFVHGNSPISRVVPDGPSGADDIRMIATARLLFGSMLPNIQVSWVKMGKKLAQMGLTCGANDFGGTLVEENISRSAGATAGSLIRPEAMRRIIRDLGRMPAERNTLYQILG